MFAPCAVWAAVRAGFLHLAEVLSLRRDSEVATKGLMASLRARERCSVEPELIGKGRSLLSSVWRPSLTLSFSVSLAHLPTFQPT